MTINTRLWRHGIVRLVGVAVTTLLLQSVSQSAEPRAGSTADSESQKVRIAVVQQETKPGAVQANRAKAICFAREALGNNADVILFHEALLVGYVSNIHALAETDDGPSTRAFQQILQGTDTLIVYGLVDKDGDDCNRSPGTVPLAPGGQVHVFGLARTRWPRLHAEKWTSPRATCGRLRENFFTSAVVVGADGVVARYRKTHLWWRAKGVRHEPTFFQPGDKLVTFPLKASAVANHAATGAYCLS